MATFRHKKSVEEHYKGTNPQEKVRGNSAEHFSSMKHKALQIKLGEKAHKNFGYRIEDHKGTVPKKGGKDFK